MQDHIVLPIPAISGNSVLIPPGITQQNDGALALSTARPQLARTAGAQVQGTSPRVVITGEKLNTSPTISGESIYDELDDPERITTRPGYNGWSTLVYHPEPNETVSPSIALIDWFAFTLRAPDGCDNAGYIGQLFPDLVRLFQITGMTDTGKGWNGYKHRLDLDGGGLLAWGGERQRSTIHIELNASGCAKTPDWEKVKEWCESRGATITRVDLAHDDFEGAIVNLETALGWYRAGQFVINGRPPKARLIDDLDSGDGKTLYIGSRTNGKLFRFYEKGRQLGDSESAWTRAELELHNKGRVIPWDVLTRPGQYLAGSAPCLAFLSELQEKIRTITKVVTITFESAVHNARQMVGKLVNVMMQFYSGDAFSVVNDLRREGIPGRLENYADFLPDVLYGEVI